MRNIPFLLAALFLAGNDRAAELTVGEIVAKANDRSYYQGKDGRARADMVVTDAQGRTRQHEHVARRAHLSRHHQHTGNRRRLVARRARVRRSRSRAVTG